MRSVTQLVSTLVFLTWILACSRAGNSPLGQSSLLALSSQKPRLLVSSIPNSDLQKLEFLALFPMGDETYLGLEVYCPDLEQAAALLGVGPDAVLRQSRDTYRSEMGDRLRVADSPELYLSCSPRGALPPFKPFIDKGRGRILLEIDAAKQEFLTMPLSCLGLQRGLGVGELMRTSRMIDLIIDGENVPMSKAYPLSCGSSRFDRETVEPWGLYFTDNFEIFAVQGRPDTGPALQVKAVDGFTPEYLISAWLQYGDGTTPADEQDADLWASARAFQNALGTQSIKPLQSAVGLGGRVRGLQLDLCARRCQDFKAQHQRDDGTVVDSPLRLTRALNGRPQAEWTYAETVAPLDFAACGADSFYSLMGLKTVDGDWAALPSDQDWMAAVRGAYRKGQNPAPIACLRASASSCLKKTQGTLRASQTDLKKLFSIDDCPDKKARRLQIELAGDLILDTRPLELNPETVKGSWPQTKLQEIAVVGKTGRERIIYAFDCAKGLVSCKPIGETRLPGLKLTGPLALSLDHLTLMRQAGGRQPERTTALEAGPQSSLSLSAVRVTDGPAFFVGLKVQGAALYLSDSDVAAASIGIEAQESRIVMQSAADKPHALSFRSLADTALGSEAQPGHDFLANLSLTGSKSAAFVVNQIFEGPRSLRTGGAAKIEVIDGSFSGYAPAAGIGSSVLRDLNGRAELSLFGGTFEGMDMIAYLDADGTSLDLWYPKKFRLNDCARAIDDPDRLVVYDRAAHIGGVMQSELERVQVHLNELSCPIARAEAGL